MLGVVVVVIGAVFVVIGLNSALGPSGQSGDAGESESVRRPVPGVGVTGRAPSRRARLVAGSVWVALGLLFMVAAFTHNVP